MDTQEIRSLLDGIRGIRDACDLDLLLFFHRHPRALLTNESLTAFVGYDPEQIAQSLDGLIAGGLLKQTRGPSATVNLYALERGDSCQEMLGCLLEFAFTRDGRVRVMRLLAAASGRSHRPGVLRSASLPTKVAAP